MTTISILSYTTGTGQRLMGVHEKTGACLTFGCAIHNPTDPNRGWPTHWTGYDIGLVHVCPTTGVFVADRDELNWRLRRAQERYQTQQCFGDLDVLSCCAEARRHDGA